MTHGNEIRDRLFSEHARLQGLLQQLLDAAEGANDPTLVDVWGDFESTLLTHLEAEEQYLFPRFEEEHPDETAQLRATHQRIRELVSELGVRADLHTLRLETVRALCDELRAHAQEEDRFFYRWADETTDPETRERLFGHLEREAKKRLSRWRKDHRGEAAE